MAIFGKKKPGRGGRAIKKAPTPEAGAAKKGGFLGGLFGKKKQTKGRSQKVEEPELDDKFFSGPEPTEDDDTGGAGGVPDEAKARNRTPARSVADSAFQPVGDYEEASSLADMLPESETDYPWEMGSPSAEKTVKAAKSLGGVLSLLGLLIMAEAAIGVVMGGMPAAIPDWFPPLRKLFTGVVLISLGQFAGHAAALFAMSCLANLRTEKAVNRVHAGTSGGIREVIEKMPVQEVAVDDFEITDMNA